ncbi:hypothetical protein RvY_12566 [Ramazzottius varieornatus]|uniref:Uncharacterized protein n=1 Tax=Ramazzottius varieornatus TaxID=947166 RepID=A0A1D1VSJ8_RAMVA|nr:hypothetical protein RvY_12566 [Ramazzottius varieornatus]
MAFNLGDRFEIYRLRYGISKLQSQIQQLIDNIPPHYITSFKSWKNPTTNALELPIDALLENSQFNHGDAEASQAAHVVLLETTVDRLLAFMQCFGVLVENVLRENNELLDPSSDLARKTSAGIIAKKVGNLLVNAVNAQETRLRKLSEKFVGYSTQTDLEEIKARDICEKCLNNDQDMRNLHSFLSDLFGPKCFSVLPQTLSEDVLRKFREEAKVCADQTNKRREKIELTRKQVIEIAASVRAKQERLAETEKKIQSVKENIIEEEAKLAAANVVLEDEEKQLSAFELTRNNARIERSKKTYDLENLQGILKEKSERARSLHEELISIQGLTEKEKTSHAILMDKLRNENESLMFQTAEKEKKLQGFTDFDYGWSEKHKVLLNDIRDLRQNWADSESVLNDQRMLLQTKEEEIAAVQEENQKLLRQIERKRIRQLESSQLEHLSEQRQPPHLTQPSLSQFSFGDTQLFRFSKTEERRTNEQFTVNESGDCVFPAFTATASDISTFERPWTTPETEKPFEECPGTTSSFASLFADFLELPDVQGMPEWDLVTDDPVPNFGILPPENSTKTLDDESTEKFKLTEEVILIV